MYIYCILISIKINRSPVNWNISPGNLSLVSTSSPVQKSWTVTPIKQLTPTIISCKKKLNFYSEPLQYSSKFILFFK